MLLMLMLMLMLKMVMMIITTTLKAAIRDFLQSPHCATNCLQHVR